MFSGSSVNSEEMTVCTCQGTFSARRSSYHFIRSRTKQEEKGEVKEVDRETDDHSGALEVEQVERVTG